MNNYETLTPAYGRDYKSKKAVLDAFNANNDFRIASTGQYCNKIDLDHESIGLCVKIRYSNLMKVLVIKKTKGGWKLQ